MQKLKLSFDDIGFIVELMGSLDSNLKIIEEAFETNIVMRENSLILIGEQENLKECKKLINNLKDLYDSGNNLDAQSIKYNISLLENKIEKTKPDMKLNMPVNSKGVHVKPKTIGQQNYLTLMEKHDITICIGPAGTGKTYLAVAMAYKYLKLGKISRIILTRPAVEAGESLGFLPGDLKMKVDPYLRPLYDALFDMMGEEKFNENIEKGVIEVAPLAYMRGRTLDNAFIILDEAQNTTPEQMKMFLTRMGFGSKMVVTGDMTQIDLPVKRSGLIQACKILETIEGIGIIKLSQQDVVRHALVQQIINAYEKYEEIKENNSPPKKYKKELVI